ncbi:cysteine--tRNA ligase [Candidatus Saccharibacteria bacterium]|nr:cysteine--tRNA ligase [Candidatus Saccharibacteria bacterium]
MKLYNTLTRKVEDFKPLGDTVKIYTCGPTVYNFPHIGNYAAYAYWDLLVRCLRLNGYKVKRVLNLTDVGHLTSDGDEGEDKLEKGARLEGKTPFEIADFYAKVYLDNYAAMEFLPADVIARATDYITEDMKAVDLMTERGYTYETRDGVYFNTAKFAEYADFARLDLAGLQAGARVDFSSEKRNVSDFAVWKFIQPGEKHAMRWDYLGRPGYPGWHLECATIIHKELGEPIDIHTGGIDHIPVHHTNEIAETYAAYGTELSRFWLHCDFITIDGQKISKSLGNTYTLEDLEKRGFSPMDYKMWLLSGHYQGTRNFTFESLEASHNRRRNWRERIAMCYQKEMKGGHFAEILEAVSDNLNSAEACALIDNLELDLSDWEKIDALFGLRLIDDTPDVSAEVYNLIRDRDAARTNKDFEKSDKIRDELYKRGIALNDSPDGAMWYYTS